MNENESINPEDLLARIIAKDREAFNVFYNLTVNRVYSLALKITQSSDMADEVVSDVYVYVWQQAGNYQSERGNVFSWLMIICRSRALDALRKNKRHIDDQVELLEHDTDHSNDSPDLLASIDNETIVFKALKQLDSQQLQLLSLAYFKGYSHNELSQMTGMPVGTVKTIIRRSLLLMQQYVHAMQN